MRPSIQTLIVAGWLAFPSMMAAQNSRPPEPFQVGDRILLVVEGDTTLSDTFTVVAGPAIQLPSSETCRWRACRAPASKTTCGASWVAT